MKYKLTGENYPNEKTMQTFDSMTGAMAVAQKHNDSETKTTDDPLMWGIGVGLIIAVGRGRNDTTYRVYEDDE